METFKYSFFSKIIYRYSNIPVTLLALYVFSLSFLFLFDNLWFVLPLTLSGAVIITVNKVFFHGYRFFPFEIKVDNKKMICTDFYNSKKKIVIPFVDVDKIEGGFFSGKPTKPIYIYANNTKTIGITPHIKNQNKLLTIILSKVKKSVYNTALSQIGLHNKK